MEWKHYKMDELIEEISMGPFGSDVKKEFYVDNGVPILNGSNLQGFKLKEDSFGYLTKEKADSLKKCNAHRGDIIVTHRGTLGQIVYVHVNSKYDRYVISQSQFRFRCKADLVDVQYLVYYFHTREGQYKILANASQVGVPALARATSTFRLIDIKLPPLDDQRRIASILSSLDRKIELNNKINADLEEMAQAIFKNWFVDFEPFKDGKFVDSELGMIPEGWKVGTLGDFCNVFTGKKNTNQAIEKGLYPFFSCAPEPLASNDAIFNGKAIIIAGNGSYTGRTMFYNGGFDLYQRTYACTIREQDKENLMIFFYHMMKQFFEPVKMGGTRGSSIPYIVMGDITQQKFPYSEERLIRFSNIANSMMDRKLRIDKEISRLSTLRDTLLPRLMSGELEVPE